MKIDLHVHSVYSNTDKFSECFNTPKRILQAAKKAGINGVALTDHDFLSYKLIKPKLKSLFVLPGVEVTTKQGHLLAYGIQDPIKKKLDLREAIDKVREQDGFIAAPHPFFFSGLMFNLAKVKVDAVEVFNANNNSLLDKLALIYAKKTGLVMTAGSDSHFHSTIGNAYVEVDCEPKVDEVINSLKKGKININLVRRANYTERLGLLYIGLFKLLRRPLNQDSILLKDLV